MDDKVGVYVHGFNPNEPCYHSTMIGIAPLFPGRGVTGAALAIQTGAPLIFFNSANNEGYLAEQSIELTDLSKFNIFDGLSEEEIHDDLVIEIISSPLGFKPKNTADEAAALMAYIQETGGPVAYIEFYIISSIDHLPRVMREMSIACLEAGIPEMISKLSYVAASTPYTPRSEGDLEGDVSTITEKILKIMRRIIILEPRGVEANSDKKVGDFLPKNP